ncbi:MAG TPA: zf-HC2 domain-containing protein [Anaerolineales bacterium]|nr:zf-HC2 domain-containing protein [Anaerolineales bacterium]
MKQHLNESELRAALDGELDPEGLSHLEACPECQVRQKTLQTQIERIAERLAFLSSPTKDTRLPASTAWHRFNQQKLNRKEIPMYKKLFASPLIRYGLPALLVLTLIIAVPDIRAFASELLNLFRVQQVTVVPVDFTGMEQLEGTVGRNISQLVSDSVTIKNEPGDPVKVANTDEASQLAGFTVRAPQGIDPTRISVMSGASFSFTIDRTKAQALLDEAGRSDLVLPEEVDGADVSVNIPSSVSIAFGTCPEPSNESEAERERKREMETSGSRGRTYADCIILAQIPSPEVSAPASLDIDKLAQIGLEFTGMSTEEAAEFTSTVDWTSTLVVPIPKNAASYQQVTVDGVTGTLIERPSDDDPQFALFWVKDGIIYTIGGLGSNAQKALEIANSLP